MTRFVPLTSSVSLRRGMDRRRVQRRSDIGVRASRFSREQRADIVRLALDLKAGRAA